MTMTANRVAAIARIRARQHRIAQARLAGAEAAVQAVANTSAQVRGFRSDFAIGLPGAAGHQFGAAGEFGLRLDAVEVVLAARMASAEAERDEVTATAITAWQEHRSVETMCDRLAKQEEAYAAARLSARLIQRRPARKAMA